MRTALQWRPDVALIDLHLGDEQVDASAFGSDWNEAFFAGDGLARLDAWVQREGARAPRVPAGTRLGPAVARPSKLVCIGLNYRDHAQETGAAIPAEPIVFMKATSAVAGPNDDVPLPPGSEKLDHEVELALVIGRLTPLRWWVKHLANTKRKPGFTASLVTPSVAAGCGSWSRQWK